MKMNLSLHKMKKIAYLHMLFFLPTLIYLTPLTSSAFIDEHYASCASPNTACGSSQEIMYPFWDGSLPTYCGHPSFKLECQSDSLTLTIRNDTYNVLDINYSSETFTVSNQQFSEGPCPTTLSQLVNYPLDSTFFNFTSLTQNVSIFYNCSKSLPSNQSQLSFSCPQDGFQRPDFISIINYLMIDEKWQDELMETCAYEIYVPVLRTKVYNLSEGFLDVNSFINEGFELKWLIDESQCKDCIESKGRCGYNETLKQHICLCENGIHDRTCSNSEVLRARVDTKKSNRGAAIGIRIAAAAAGSVILISILFLLYRCLYKKNQSSVGRVSQNKSFSTTLDPNGSSYFGVNVFNYGELEEATDSFAPGKELGRGGFGAVYHGILRDGREVAVKQLYEKNNHRAEQFLNEVEILAKVHHRNLVTLYGCTSRKSRQLLLVYEFVSNGTLADHLHGSKANLRLLPWATRLRIALEITTGLLYLHSSDIIHRDVKTVNILLDIDFTVKVADFGLSRLFPLDVTHVSTDPKGTLGYMDPDYFNFYQLTEKSDVYSLGVVLAELISSKKAIDLSRRDDDINLGAMLKNKIQSGELDDFVDPLLGFGSGDIRKEITVVAELAVECLESTPDTRPSMKQVLDKLQNI